MGSPTQEQQGGLAQEVEPESGGTEPENALERAPQEESGARSDGRHAAASGESEGLASSRTSPTQAANRLNGSARRPYHAQESLARFSKTCKVLRHAIYNWHTSGIFFQPHP